MSKENKCPLCKSNKVKNHGLFLDTKKTEHGCQECGASWLEYKGKQICVIKIRGA